MNGKFMNRKIIAIGAVTAVLALWVIASDAYAGGDRLKVPRVAYSEPKDQSAIDLTGKDALMFRWNSVPIPGGGREAFRFKVYKGFTYDLVVSKDIDEKTFSVDVPADHFVDGETYTWSVEQRDARNMIWSRSIRWSFKVIKK